MRYNYYILSQIGELYSFLFSDLEGLDEVKVITSTHKLMGWKYPFWRIHTGKDFNKKVSFPFKSVWNTQYLKGVNKFKDKDKPICFVLLGIWASFAFETGLCETIRKQYPSAKIVWYNSDILSKRRPMYPKEWNKSDYPDMDYAHRIFDMILSYDQGDCEKHDLVYYPTFYSSFHGEKQEMKKSDVYFCGRAKDRLPEIISAYEKLRDAGLKPDFYVTGVPENEQVYPGEITYGSGMSYQEIIQHILNSKALLEIMQKGASGFTVRTNEAVVFDKKLITNNPALKDAPFYNPEYISIFSEQDASDLDTSFLKKLKSDDEKADYHYKDKVSPKAFLQFLDDRL